jgi:hypothetical protein
MRKGYLIRWLAVCAISIFSWASTAVAAPLTFNIPSQPLFGTLVSGHLTFDPSGIYFAGTFDISVGAIPSAGLPAAEFTDLSVYYVIQPNTSFHSLWVFHNPFDNLFLFVSYDSCSLTGSTITSCVFEMTYYQSGCSDCPQTARVQGAVIGTPAAEHVTIDILPDSLTNAINPKSAGVIPVAILTTPTFDAATVDSGSVKFGPYLATSVDSALVDVDGDSDLDLILHFRSQQAGIKCGDTSLSLTGGTSAGQAIEGSDSIKTVACK